MRPIRDSPHASGRSSHSSPPAGTNAQIAAELWVTPATVKKHLENVYLKLGVGSRAAAASRVQSTG